jgi:hypothetical protein
MNERIKELVRESNLDVYGLGKEKYKWEYTVEKFAELIIRECAGVNYNSVFKDGEFCAREVLEHFGVEDE